MKLPSFSIRWKLLGGFVGLALLVLAVVLFAVSSILDNRIREDINANFREAGKIFEQLQDVRFRQLHQTATLVADMPYMKAAISTGDVNTINNQIRQELVQLLHFDPIITDTLTSGSLSSSADSVGLVMVFDPRGMPLGQLADAELPPHSMADKAGVRPALEGHSPRQSYIWKQRGSYFNVITIPVFLRGQVIAALSLGYPIRNVETELLAQLIEYEVSYFVDNRLLATSIESLSGKEKKELTKNIQNSLSHRNLGEGATLELDMEGQRWLVNVLPMSRPGLNRAGVPGYYTVAQSLTQALTPLHELQRVIYFIGLGGILLAMVFGITLTRNLTRPINLLLDGIKKIENDEYDEPVEVVSRDEFGQLTHTFNALVANIRGNLREKETLLAEIHHRVKNNLAVISGLLQLEGDNAGNEDIKAILKNSQLRIQSMATVHEMLYKAQDFNNLSFDNFVSEMVSYIQKVHKAESSDIDIHLAVDDIHLNVNQAVPCGLIINELLTNAFKHAYPPGRSGPINVILRERGNNIFLQVKDEGTGLPPYFELRKSESLGFTLIKILTKQINADIEINGQNGTEISLTFEKKEKKGPNSSLNVS